MQDLHGTIEFILNGLNEQQRKAVTFDYTKALQVIAGPGTGKTKVLTSRVAYLLLNHGIPPGDIIVTTFTNKAAKEMTDRLASLLKGTHLRVSDVMIGTFHGLCLRILLKHGHDIGLPPNWRIIDEKDTDSVLYELISQMPDHIRDYSRSMGRKVNLCLPTRGSDEWSVHPKLLKKHISRLKSNSVLPEEYQDDSTHDTALAYFYQKYQQKLYKMNCLDFDDLLMLTFRLLSMGRYLPSVKHVLVDEFQDTNGIQVDLMFVLAKGNRCDSKGFTIVGDPDQSIYAFRNALAQNFIEMENKCPLECERIVLTENYRSSQSILNTSEQLIKQQSKGRISRPSLRAQYDTNLAPVFLNLPAPHLEATTIAKEILYLKAIPELFTYDDYAILVRQRRQIKQLEQALIDCRIPYKILRGKSFWESKEIIAILNLFKAILPDDNSNAIFASLVYPARGLGPTSLERLKNKFSSMPNISCLDFLRDVINLKLKIDIPSKAKEAVKHFVEMIDVCIKLKSRTDSQAVTEIFDYLYEHSGLKREYLFYDGNKKSKVNLDTAKPNYHNTRHKNVEILRGFLLGHRNSNTDTDQAMSSIVSVDFCIRDFLNSLMLNINNDAQGDPNEKADQSSCSHDGTVTISTIHGSKGLEWPVVFIPGCEDGIIPSIFSDGIDDSDSENDLSDNNGDDKDNKKNGIRKKDRGPNFEDSMDEERRMFFVAQTRAKHLLYLTSVTYKDDHTTRVPSRFLTKQVLSTVVGNQVLFRSPDTIYNFFQLLGKTFPKTPTTFSVETLLNDHLLFIGSNEKRFYWNGNQITSFKHFRLDRNVNLQLDIKSSITTAGDLIRATRIGMQREPSTNVLKKSKLASATLDLIYSAHTQRNEQIKDSLIKQHAIKDVNSDLSIEELKDDQSTSFNIDALKYAPSHISGDNSSEDNSENVHTILPSKETPSLNSEASNISEESMPLSALNYRLKSIPSPTNLITSNTLAGPSLNARGLNETFPCKEVNHKLFVKDALVEVQTIDIDGSESYTELAHTKTNRRDKRPLYMNSHGGEKETLKESNKLSVPQNSRLTNHKYSVQGAHLKSEKTAVRASKKKTVKYEPDIRQIDIFHQLSRAKKKAKSNNQEPIVID